MAAGHFLLGPGQSKLRKCKLLILESVKHIRKGNLTSEEITLWIPKPRKRIVSQIVKSLETGPFYSLWCKWLIWSLLPKVTQDSTFHSCMFLNLHPVQPSAVATELSAVALQASDSRGWEGGCPARMKSQLKDHCFSFIPMSPGFCMNQKIEHTWKALAHPDELYRNYQLFFIVLADDLNDTI